MVMSEPHIESNTHTECEHCSHKTKKRSPDEMKGLMNRISRIQGQLNGIKKMIENDAYCTDVLMQVSAASAAMNGLTKEILSAHIKTCVVEHLKAGDDSVVDELVSTVQKLS